MTKNHLTLFLCVLFLIGCSARPTMENPTSTPSITEAIIPNTPSNQTITFTPTLTFTPSPTPSVEAHLSNGNLALVNGDYLRAQTEFQAAFSNSADAEVRAAALWGLGRVEYEAGNKGKALIDLRNLDINFPGTQNAVRANFIMGEIYMSLERYSEAAQAFSNYLSGRPGILDSYVQEECGDAYLAAGNISEAISFYKDALAAPHIGDDTALRMKLAQAYEDLGDTSLALNIYDAIFQASTNDYIKAEIDLLSGRLYLSMGETDQAYQRFLDAVNNYPLSYDSYSALVALVNADVPVDDLQRGLTDYYAGQYGYALEAFQRYIVANLQNDGTAHYFLAMTLIQQGNYQEGVDGLTDFIANYPDNQYWQSAWGKKADTLWIELGDNAAAAQTYLNYSKANPDIMFAPQALLNAGRNYERANRLDDAARVWESVADSYPGSDLVPQAVFFAGIARYRAHEFDQALVTFLRDLQFSTGTDDMARALFWIGKTHQALGDDNSAQSAWQQAAALNPIDYYSLRAQDILLKRPPFEPASRINYSVDLNREREEAEAWLRVSFDLPTNTDLRSPGELLSDPRLIRGTELWVLGLADEARLEFEDLRTAIAQNPADCYRLANYLRELGLFRPAINAYSQVLHLAGISSLPSIAAPAYFNHVIFGFYYQDIVVPAAKQNGFDPLFLFSVIWQESQFEGFVRSSAGAIGLMQIIPSTGQEIATNLHWPTDYKDEDLYRPVINISLGATYLAQQRLHFDGDLFTTLAAYNGGPGAATIWRELSGSDYDLFVEVVRSEETRNYMRSIYVIDNMYRSLYGAIPQA